MGCTRQTEARPVAVGCGTKHTVTTCRTRKYCGHRLNKSKSCNTSKRGGFSDQRSHRHKLITSRWLDLPSAEKIAGPPGLRPKIAQGLRPPFPTGLWPPFLQAFGPLSYRPSAPFPTGLWPPFLQALGPLSYRPSAPFPTGLWPSFLQAFGPLFYGPLATLEYKK